MIDKSCFTGFENIKMQKIEMKKQILEDRIVDKFVHKANKKKLKFLHKVMRFEYDIVRGIEMLEIENGFWIQKRYWDIFSRYWNTKYMRFKNKDYIEILNGSEKNVMAIIMRIINN